MEDERKFKMEGEKYRNETWIDPRVGVRESRIGGEGLFAEAPIREGEMVMIWGGTLMKEDEIEEGKYKKGTAVEVGEGLYLAGKPESEPERGDRLNHSCDPNLWLRDEVTLEAKRDITAGEELTADYGTWVSRPGWRMECKCGS